MNDEGGSRGRDPVVTSRIMAQVKNKDSRAEVMLRRHLHAMGLRYRIHYKVVGRPDIAFPSRRVAIFVDGDFWHGNAWKLRSLGSLAELFPTRTEWWVAKITRTMERDLEVTRLLTEHGWIVLRYWESEVLADPVAVASRISTLIRGHCERPSSS